MDRIKNHMQYYYFFDLPGTDWMSNGHMALKKEVLDAVSIRYSKCVTDNYLYKPKDAAAMSVVVDSFKQYLAATKRYNNPPDRILLKPPLDKSIGHLWCVWYNQNTSYIFDADLAGFALHRLKGRTIRWAIGIHEEKIMPDPRYSWSRVRLVTRPFLFLMENDEPQAIICNIDERDD